jgi:hypothetical protein
LFREHLALVSRASIRDINPSGAVLALPRSLAVPELLASRSKLTILVINKDPVQPSIVRVLAAIGTLRCAPDHR